MTFHRIFDGALYLTALAGLSVASFSAALTWE